jgi:hypothetical protein
MIALHGQRYPHDHEEQVIRDKFIEFDHAATNLIYNLLFCLVYPRISPTH